MIRRGEDMSPIRQISIEGIDSRISGPGMTFTILDAWAESGGQRVTELEIGKGFVVKVRYECSWPELPWYQVAWVVSVTASDGKTINLYDNTTIFGGSKTGGTMTLDNPKPAVMPAENVRLVIQPWGSDKDTDYFTTPPKPWI